MITEQQFEEMNRRTVGAIGKLRPEDAVPVSLEKELHEFIFDDARCRGWIVLHGAMSERTHRTPGEFDFIILAGSGLVFLIECKTRTGKLSPEQLAMKVHAEMLGHKPAVVRSIADYYNVISPATKQEEISHD
jgi:hypothetical protein